MSHRRHGNPKYGQLTIGRRIVMECTGRPHQTTELSCHGPATPPNPHRHMPTSRRANEDEKNRHYSAPNKPNSVSRTLVGAKAAKGGRWRTQNLRLRTYRKLFTPMRRTRRALFSRTRTEPRSSSTVATPLKLSGTSTMSIMYLVFSMLLAGSHL